MASSKSDAHVVLIKIKTLINAQLKQVLRKEHLAVSGAKAAMQDRLTARGSPLLPSTETSSPQLRRA